MVKKEPWAPKRGRPPAEVPLRNRYALRLSDEDNGTVKEQAESAELSATSWLQRFVRDGLKRIRGKR